MPPRQPRTLRDCSGRSLAANLPFEMGIQCELYVAAPEDAPHYPELDCDPEDLWGSL
jgi:hypothetical protein